MDNVIDDNDHHSHPGKEDEKTKEQEERDHRASFLGGNSAASQPSSASPAIATGGAEFSLNTLNVVRTLGCGAFGRVKMVTKAAGAAGKDKSSISSEIKTYALKCQSKKAIVDSNLQDHVLNERKIICQLDHPFIIKCFGAFKDDHSIYFVLELLLGGELFTQLRHIGGHLDELGAKFYSAQVLLAFQHMHAKKIAYRDLKPENLVLDEHGYAKVVDFGLAKVVDNAKTWTLCGTPDYLAPEIILNEGHDKAVDYWALGVLIYEMVAGMPPFYAEDPMQVYEKILGAKIAMPHAFSRNLSDLIRKLCKIYQSKRLGNGKGGTATIQKHKWFSNFDFKGLIQKELKAPIKPTVTSSTDTSNFDPYEGGTEPPDPVVSEKVKILTTPSACGHAAATSTDSSFFAGTYLYLPHPLHLQSGY